MLTYPYSDNPVFPGTPLNFSYSPRYQAVKHALLDQAGSSFGFILIGGYGWRPVGASDAISPSELAPASVKDLFDYAFYGVATRPGQAHALATSQLTAQIVTFLKKYDVGSVVVLPVGQTPSTMTNALSAAIGAPRRSGGVPAWFNVQHRLKSVTPQAFRVTGPPPVTTLVRPVTGSHLHGGQYLVASESDAFAVKSVTFELSGIAPAPTDICHGSLFQYGWICGWNSTSVPNGTYTLRSVATDNVGQMTHSTGVIVHVQNSSGSRPSRPVQADQGNRSGLRIYRLRHASTTSRPPTSGLRSICQSPALHSDRFGVRPGGEAVSFVTSARPSTLVPLDRRG